MRDISFRTIRQTVALAALLSALRLGAQPPDDALTKLRALHLQEAIGPVPLMYSPAVKQRAIRYQKALQAAHQWYEKRLHLRLPITLAVLDMETFKRAGAIATPYSDLKTGLIVLPSHLEDLTSLRPLGVDFALTSEAVAFHEAGHIFAETLLKIDGSGFVRELVANIFMAAYIRAARPDLKFLLAGPFAKILTPRYTSGADLVYLSALVGVDNYFWFQSRLHVLADFCLKGGSFTSVIEKFRRAFPSGHRYLLPIADTIGRLDELFPGFRAQAGELGAPSTIRTITPAVCQPEAAGIQENKRQAIVFRNDTPDPIVLTDYHGATVHLRAGFWERFVVTSGTSIRLPDGTCLVVLDEPGLAVFEKPQSTQR